MHIYTQSPRSDTVINTFSKLGLTLKQYSGLVEVYEGKEKMNVLIIKRLVCALAASRTDAGTD